MAITALPALNRTASTFRDDVDTFFGTQLPAFSVETEAARVEINSNTQTATTQAQLATTQAQLATTQATAAASSALSAGATIWVSGTTYTAGVSKYSPLDGQVYRRMITGAGTIDPSLDAVNWRVVNGLTSELIVLPFNNLPSMRPSLNLDFANNQAVDPRIAFTRASVATRTNNKGLIEVVASGVPRIDYDDVTGACKGLLIEEQRANLLVYSEQFDNAAWPKTRSTVTANATIAPDGLLTADKLVEDTTANLTHVVYAGAYVATNVMLTASCYVKAGERTRILMEISNFSTGAATCVFDLAAGTAGSPGNGGDYTGTTAVITAVGGGWYRLSITASKGAFNANNHVSLSLHNGTSATYTGDGTSGLFIWGAQLEAGAFPTTYIPTVASQVTRAADVASMTGASFSSWFNANEFSMLAIGSVASFDKSAFQLHRVVALDDSASQSIAFRAYSTGTGNLVFDVFSAAASVDSSEFTANTPNQVVSTSAGFAANNGAFSRNGLAAEVDTSVTMVSGLNRLLIGEKNMHIRSLSYYPKRLTNAELQALSTQ